MLALSRTDKFKFIVEISKCCPAIKVCKKQHKIRKIPCGSFIGSYLFIGIEKIKVIISSLEHRVSLRDKKVLARKSNRARNIGIMLTISIVGTLTTGT